MCLGSLLANFASAEHSGFRFMGKKQKGYQFQIAGQWLSNKPADICEKAAASVCGFSALGTDVQR